jgi:MFS transporter, FSR family, fosmidomycin resistance protein
MRSIKSITAFQWTQLYGLSFAHGIANLFIGMIPAILPAIRTEFNLSLSRSVVLVSICFLTCNFVQVFFGHLRPDKKRPLFLTIGLAMCGAICFCGFLGNIKGASLLLMVLVVIMSTGVALTHPESLRAVHLLRRISPATGTAVFLNGGVLGFCSGGLLAAAVVSLLGLKGLLLFILLPVASIILVKLLRIRLAVDRQQPIVDSARVISKIPFWLLFFMAVPFTTSATVFSALIPTRLNELGFELYFGAMPNLLWSIGAIAGAFFWSAIADKRSPLPIVVLSSILAVPLLIAYLILIRSPFSIWLLLLGGFGGFAGFSVIVSMARYSSGTTNLGRKMGYLVGGTWGLAALILMALSPVAESCSVAAILNLSWLGYFLTAMIGFIIMKTQKKRTPAVVEERANVSL